ARAGIHHLRRGDHIAGTRRQRDCRHHHNHHQGPHHRQRLHRMRPLVLRDYFGNLVLWLFPRCDVGELVTRSTHDTAEPIHRAVAGIDDAYFRSFVDFTSSRAVEADGLIPIADTAEVVVCLGRRWAFWSLRAK
ncbi:Os08g0331100, partial [Oryza sativa Japonica Group]